MTIPTNPHDRLFRQAFSKPEVAQPFFERYLPAAVVAELDFTTMVAAQESFIDPDLSQQQTDVLFQLQTRTAKSVLAYLLIEHKSYSDPWVGLQLFSYMVRVWEREKTRLGRPPLPPIVPLVLYHDERAWSRGTNFRDWIDAPGAFTPYVPAFEFALCDLSQDQLDGLQQRAWLAATLQVLKYSRSDELPGRLADILALFRQLVDSRETADEALAFLGTVLRYLVQVAGQLDKTTLQVAMKKALPANIGETIMPTIAEAWVEEGRGLGVLEGQRVTLRRQLAKKFGPLPETVTEKIDQADQATLEHWTEQVLEASSLEALFPDH